MNEEAVLELGQQAMITAMTIAAPVLIVGAAVGLLDYELQPPAFNF